MKYKIGVFGSAEGNFDKILDVAYSLGKELAKQNIILITGATTGIPHEVEKVAKENGAELWGYSPATNREKQQAQTPNTDISIYDKLVYIPSHYEFANNIYVTRKYRNVTSTATCDAGIIISGRWGTLNEFTNLFDMGKVIGVLTGTGGISDELSNLMGKIKKKSRAKVLFNSDPSKLIREIIDELSKRFK